MQEITGSSAPGANRISAGIVAGVVVVTATVAATPFLVPDVAASLDVAIGVTGLLSTAQIATSALVIYLAGRLLTPKNRYHRYGALMLLVSSAGSAAAHTFAVLAATRVVAGVGLGLMTWTAWVAAAHLRRGLSDIAAVGPMTAIVCAPVLAWLLTRGGYRLVYVVLACVAGATLALRVNVPGAPRTGWRTSRSPASRVVLLALMAYSLGTSAAFVFIGAVAIHGLGMKSPSFSLTISLSAVTGVLATRFHARSQDTAYWLAATGVAVLAVGNTSSVVLFVLAMSIWGFAYWMSIPAVLRLLAAGSRFPSERTGDAQAHLAIGQLAGPVVGAWALSSRNDFGRVSIVSGLLVGAAAVLVAAIEQRSARRVESQTSG